LRLQRCERAAAGLAPVRWCRWRNIAEIRFRVGLTCFGEKPGTAHKTKMLTCDSDDTRIFFLTGFEQCVVKENNYSRESKNDLNFLTRQILDLNNTYTMYYYGIYNDINIPYVNYLIEYNDIFPIQPNRYNINYQLLGVYLLKNSDNMSNYKINIEPHEPEDFYKQMMLYLIPENNKIISCPYWIYREEN
jgi:hypothetical protein